MKRLFGIACLGAIALAAIATPLHAAAVWGTWTGANGTDFYNPLNWSPNLDGTSDNWLRVDVTDATSPVINTTNPWTVNNFYVGTAYAPYPVNDVGDGYPTPTTTPGKVTVENGGILNVNWVFDIGAGAIPGTSSVVMTGGVVNVQQAIQSRMGINGGSAILTMSGSSQFNQTNGGELLFGVNDASAPSTSTGEASLSDSAFLQTSTHYRIGDNASFGGTRLVQANGSITMTGSSHIQNSNRQVIIGYGVLGTGSVTLTGDGVTAGVQPFFENVGGGTTTWVGIQGATGSLSVTNAKYQEAGWFIVGGWENGGGNGTVTVATTPGSANPGTLEVGAHLLMNYQGNSSGYAEVNVTEGSSLSVAGWFGVGYSEPGAALGSTSVFNNSGTVVKGTVDGFLVVGRNGSGTINQNAGLFTDNTITCLGQWGNTGTLNLNGGVFSTSAIQVGYWNEGIAKGTINFNGGTLKLNTSGLYQAGSGSRFFNPYQSDPGNARIYLKAGGATIDDSGANISMGVPLQEAAGSTGGGLTKLGSGTVNLVGANTYTGATSVNEGILRLRGTATLATSAITVASGTTLDLVHATRLTNSLTSLDLQPGSTLIASLTPSTTDPNAINTASMTTISGVTFMIDALGTSLTKNVPYTLIQGFTGATEQSGLPVITRMREYSATAKVTPTSVEVTVADTGLLAANLLWNASYLNWDIGVSPSWDGADGVFYNLDSVAFDDGYPLAPEGKVVNVMEKVHPASISINVIDETAPFTFQGIGAITGVGTTLTKTGNGEAIVNCVGGIDITGNITLAGGTLTFGAGLDATTLPGNVAISANSVINLLGFDPLTLPGIISDDGSGLRKAGGGKLIVTNEANTYTGPTIIAGGTLQVSKLADGGASSPIGVSSNDPSNLVLQGNGTLVYTGPSVTIDRGVTSDLNWTVGGINVASAATVLEFTGVVTNPPSSPVTVDQSFATSGPGTVKFNNPTPMANSFGGGFYGQGGRIIFDGVAATETTPSSTYNTNMFQVATSGQTILDINNVAITATAVAYLGSFGGTLDMTMTGTSSLTLPNGGLYLGRAAGNGDLKVLDSAQLSVAGEMWLGVNSYSTDYHGSMTIGGTSTTAPAVVTIGSHIYVGLGTTKGNITMSGTGELRLNPSATAENEHFGWDSGSIATVIMTGHSKIISNNVYTGYAAGWFVLGDFGGVADFTLSDYASISLPTARLKIGGSYNGVAGKATMTLNDSATVTAGGLVTMNEEGGLGQGILNLNGGTFTAPGIFGINSQINFKGGTLKANAASADYLSGGGIAVTVGKNTATSLGAVIDTDVHAVTITTGLAHDAFGPAIDGGLMKLGTGALTITAPISYTGNTVVNDGALSVSALNTPSAMVYVATGATLNASSIVADTLTIGGTPLAAASSVAAVPEPSTIVLLALAGLALAGAYIRRK